MKIEVSEIDVEGNVGHEAYVKARKATIGGLTHKTSMIEADEIDINVHKGTAKGKLLKCHALNLGVVERGGCFIRPSDRGKHFCWETLVRIALRLSLRVLRLVPSAGWIFFQSGRAHEGKQGISHNRKIPICGDSQVEQGKLVWG